MMSYKDQKKFKKLLKANPDVNELKQSYKEMKKDLLKIKNASAKFNGHDFDPMNQLRSGVDHLNYQIADFRARNTNLIASENKQLQNDLERMRDEEEKRRWRDHYKDKYKDQQQEHQLQTLQSHIDHQDFMVKSKLQATTLAAAGAAKQFVEGQAITTNAILAQTQPLPPPTVIVPPAPVIAPHYNPYLPHHTGYPYSGYPYGYGYPPPPIPPEFYAHQAPYVVMGGPVPYLPPWGINPMSLHQPYFMRRNPTYDYINTQHKLFQETEGEIQNTLRNP